MEDWQEWQQRADEVAAQLSSEVSELEAKYLAENGDPTFRSFWPRFRDLKERVRTAPAIKLDAKLDLERRLRTLGSRAYKAQEGAYAQSGGRKDELLGIIGELRSRVESADVPRDLRALRRDLDAVRGQFDTGPALVPADRQAVWEAWRDTNNLAWDRLNALWSENEAYLREILDEARRQLEAGNAGGVRTSVGRFFEALKTREAKQNAMNAMKAEADGMRRDAERSEERRAAERTASQQASHVSPVDAWRTELIRNREGISRLAQEVEQLEREHAGTNSILEQAMVRGNLVDKRRKLAELERTNKSLEQRIEQSESSPLISAG